MNAHFSSQVPRAALIGSFVISFLALLLAFWGWEQSRKGAEGALHRDASLTARVADLYVRERLDTLAALARAPALHDDRSGAQQSLFDAIPGVAGFRTMAAIDSQGYVVTVTGGAPPGPPTFVGDRDHVQQVLLTHAPVVGSAISARIIEGTAVPFAIPFDDATGRIAVLSAGIYLVGQDSLRFSPDDSLKLLDRRGQVIIDASNHLPPLTRVADWDLYSSIMAGKSGVRRGSGLSSGRDSVIAFSTVPSADWTVVLEHPAREMFAAADSRFGYEAAAILLFFTSTSMVLVILEGRARRQRRLEFAARERAEQAIASRNEFVTRVVHDLRTPLTVVKAAATLVERREREARRRALDALQDGIIRLESLLADMDGTRGDSLTAAFRPFDVRTMLERVVQQQQLLDAQRSFLAEMTAEPGASSEVLWDEDLIVRALENLLSNARKYSDANAPVELRMHLASGGVSIAVVDHGRGIPEDDLPHVLEPFHRGTNVAGTPGIGVGLANVAAIVALHGGTIDISSRQGRGTSVTVQMPHGDVRSGAVGDQEADGAGDASGAPEPPPRRDVVPGSAT